MSELILKNKSGKVLGKINEETGEEFISEEWQKSPAASGVVTEELPTLDSMVEKALKEHAEGKTREFPMEENDENQK